MIIIQNGELKLKILFLTHLTRHSALAFGSHEKWRSPKSKLFFSNFRIEKKKKTELKNLVSIKGYGSEKSI